MSQQDERRARLALNLLPEVTPRLAQEILLAFGTISQALAAPLSQWQNIRGVTEDLYQRIQEMNSSSAPEEEMALAKELDVWISISPDYPEALAGIFDPPLVLYGKGSWQESDQVSVALVGSRRLSPYGESVAATLAKDLARSHVTTVSGLARGIDTVVHRETLAHGGRTIAVLGNGLASCYPPENRKLLEAVAKSGVVVSEFPLKMRPLAGNFPRRNRIISGLAFGTVVVEAQQSSGALITAAAAAEQGREVFAVPGPIHSETSQGVHRLIRQGAKLVSSAEDILEEMAPYKERWRRTMPKVASPQAALRPEEALLLSSLGTEPVAFESLSTKTALPAGSLSQHLVTLEMKGYVKALPGKTYVKKI